MLSIWHICIPKQSRYKAIYVTVRLVQLPPITWSYSILSSSSLSTYSVVFFIVSVLSAYSSLSSSSPSWLDFSTLTSTILLRHLSMSRKKGTAADCCRLNPANLAKAAKSSKNHCRYPPGCLCTSRPCLKSFPTAQADWRSCSFVSYSCRPSAHLLPHHFRFTRRQNT